jgi:hypothetical protein
MTFTQKYQKPALKFREECNSCKSKLSKFVIFELNLLQNLASKYFLPSKIFFCEGCGAALRPSPTASQGSIL